MQGTFTVEEKLRILDEIVGRCVRDPIYAIQVLDDPNAVLGGFADDDVISDFHALARDRENTLTSWRAAQALLPLA